MDRRETLKTMMVGAIAGASIGTAGCAPNKETETAAQPESPLYGRTPKELERDAALMKEQFFTPSEASTLAVLCDIILPATPSAVSAVDAGVPEFVEFIAKDMPNHQVPLRGGLMWLNTESNRRYNKAFEACSNSEQIEIIEDIAYPFKDDENSNFGPGVAFFNLVRNLTLTGYYTSKPGLADLGYKGNIPNIWDGVPEDVLAEHGMSYDQEWLDKCINQDTREAIAEWDDEGNLLT